MTQEKKVSRLQSLSRTAGNIEPELSYNKTENEKKLKQVEENLQKVEQKRTTEKKVNNQKNSLKYSDAIKKKLDAQKQIEDIKYDYALLELLLDRNADNYSQKDKAKYNILID